MIDVSCASCLRERAQAAQKTCLREPIAVAFIIGAGPWGDTQPCWPHAIHLQTPAVLPLTAGVLSFSHAAMTPLFRRG
ncbi:hypothetical protein AS156_16740 [Bradyrhizobium macuxiense]|uniref:Uncharacterized protein n=1 Tax=Bradyrhizobium macuxiense TaxID=1755647 RepID=A0A109JHK1_9BRAD|nr:hypothetical protein AS156_16740 [Bradyrhizobium macuxiense]